MTWLVKEKIGLPVLVERVVWADITAMVATGDTVDKGPGDTITVAEMKAAGQTDDDIAALIRDGALEEN